LCLQLREQKKAALLKEKRASSSSTSAPLVIVSIFFSELLGSILIMFLGFMYDKKFWVSFYFSIWPASFWPFCICKCRVACWRSFESVIQWWCWRCFFNSCFLWIQNEDHSRFQWDIQFSLWTKFDVTLFNSEINGWCFLLIGIESASWEFVVLYGNGQGMNISATMCFFSTGFVDLRNFF